MKRLLPLLLLAATVCPAAPRSAGVLSARIRRVIAGSPLARTAFWGIEFADTATGHVLFQLNADHFFVPASNTKLFSTALALSRLGPDYKVHTRVFATVPPDAAGELKGDLVLVGAGDANLSGRTLPYQMDADRGDPLAVIEDLAQQIFDKGVRRVQGNIIGDDTAFLYEPYGEGWGLRDPVSEDGAPVSALVVNDNAIALHAAPGDMDTSPVRITFDPPLPVFSVENATGTDVERRVHVEREPGSTILRVWGGLPATAQEAVMMLGVDDPARYAALALQTALQKRGITVAGTVVARHAFPGFAPLPAVAGTVVADRESPRLLEDLRVTDKISQNLHAEILLRLVARQAAGVGSAAEGLKALEEFLDEAGIEPDQYNLHDGSGLSRLNVVTPHAIVVLLRYMAQSEQKDNWLSLLPVAGVDGSLRERFKSPRFRGRLSGKTGSLTHVSALSGYANRRHGGQVAFSIVVNNYNGPTADIRAVIDKICSLVLE